MSAILDTIVPARRREKRRILALEERLHTRYGDPAITTPIEGAWSSFNPDHPDEERQTSSASFPNLEAVQEHTTVGVATDSDKVTSTSKEAPTASTLVDEETQMAKLTISIPLPWSRKSHRKSTSYHGQVTADAKDFTDSTSQSQTTSPVAVVYKPASEHYRKELEAALTKSATATASPVLYRAASEGYRKELDNMANLPTLRHTTSDPVPYESIPAQREGARDDESKSTPSQGGIQSASTDASVPSIDDRASLTTDDATSGSSSPSLRSEDMPNTPPTASSVPDHVTTELAHLGLSPSPGLKQGSFSTLPSTSPIVRMNPRESVSSSSSNGTDGSLRSPRNLQNASISGGGYYKSVADEYKQIAKTVEDAVVADYKQRQRRNSAQNPPTVRAREKSAERPRTSARESVRPAPTALVQRRKSMEKIQEDGRLNRLSMDTHLGLPERPRNMSVDRSRTYQHDRSRGLSVERNRGKSVDRALRGVSRDRMTRGPQQLVPQPEELWG